MKRRAFTLMEMLVSVVLIVLITLFMYGAIAASRMTTTTLTRHAGTENNRTMLYDLFYRDLLEATSVSVLPTQDKRFNVLMLQTRNSLYDIAVPHVVYFVHSQLHRLVRLESAKEIKLPVNFDDKYFVHADAFLSDVEDFNIMFADAPEESNSTNGGNGGRESNTTRTTGMPGSAVMPANASLSASDTGGKPKDYQSALLFLRSARLGAPLLLEIRK